MLLKDKKVAVIGAGPVGLTMARLLQQKGMDVTVYERDKNATTRISGGTLDLHAGSGQDALKAAGLLEQYYAMALPMGRTVTDAQGNVLLTKKPAAEEQYDNPEINRNDLRQLLLASLADGTVIWDARLTSLEAQDEQWLLQFESGSNAKADFVIGANGGMSKVRQYVTDATIEYSGTIILQGEVARPEENCPEFYQRCDGNILMTSANGTLLVANPENGGQLTYSVIFERPASWVQGRAPDKGQLIHFLQERCAGWADLYQQLFRSTDSFVVWPTRRIPLEIPWKAARPLPITLVGDAAHIMPPFAGQGVNIGLQDALILSENLTDGKFETLEAAIAGYEEQMKVYASDAQEETSRNELAMRAPGFSFRGGYE